MPRLLKDIRINEVSSVDRGAGRGVKVLLMKRDNPPANGEIEMTKEEIDALVSKSVGEAVATATKPLTETIAKLQRETVVLKMSDTHKAFMSQCDEATQKSFADMTDEQRDAFMAKNPIKKAADPVQHSEVADLTKRLGDQSATIISLQKRLDDQDAIAKRADFSKRAAALGAKNEGDGDLMMKAYSGDADAAVKWDARLVEVNKALAAQVREGALFGEFGTAKSETGGTSAYQTLLAKAEEVRKADGKLTQSQAFAKVYEDPANAELVARNKREELTRSASVYA